MSSPQFRPSWASSRRARRAVAAVALVVGAVAVGVGAVAVARNPTGRGAAPAQPEQPEQPTVPRSSPPSGRAASPGRSAGRVVMSVLAVALAIIGAFAGVLDAGDAGSATAPARAAADTTSAAGSLAPPAQVDPGRTVEVPVVLVAAASADVPAVPPVAMAAYQRAAAVIARADPGCHLDAELVAAVGGVVSAHGGIDGGGLSADGVVRPALVGPFVADDRGARLADTDAGRLDGDERHDRAVGPMLLTPTTWSVAGVDSDGNGTRDPQDIDDAALAVGVLLCYGGLDLRGPHERRRAVSRINSDHRFVRTVLAVATAYAEQHVAPLPTLPGPLPVPGELPVIVSGMLPVPGQGPPAPVLHGAYDDDLDLLAGPLGGPAPTTSGGPSPTDPTTPGTTPPVSVPTSTADTGSPLPIPPTDSATSPTDPSCPPAGPEQGSQCIPSATPTTPSPG